MMYALLFKITFFELILLRIVSSKTCKVKKNFRQNIEKNLYKTFLTYLIPLDSVSLEMTHGSRHI